MHKKIKTTITLSSHIKEFATEEAKSLGLDFSAYITVLIVEKLRGYNVINTMPAPISTNLDTSIKDIPVEPKEEIDEFQIDELDRLLSLTADE
ncbi:hypothetical protein [Clostridium disporicum]|uniref:Uncharacterized protein n=1 Tax=Clostridium disporicum TaxID=84024 RepID=A0A174ELE7_9CLOT|nr:hypothetical protein [Clostridium disporicum]CUO38634.1 Uncharacterised protein [Clostridium disporicum]